MVSDRLRKGVLIVDDNDADIELLRQLFAAKEPDADVRPAMNEEEFLNFIRLKDGQLSVPDIDIVIVDFNMPRDEGIAVLKRLKSDPSLRKIPVIVFSGSESKGSIRKAYELGANSYLVKPVAFDELSNIVDLIIRFWLHIACLPSQK